MMVVTTRSSTPIKCRTSKSTKKLSPKESKSPKYSKNISPSKKSKNVRRCLSKSLISIEPSNNNDHFSQAKILLNRSVPSNIIGRTKECNQIQDFLIIHLENKKASSLYVSGPPGTGKTACIEHIINKISKTNDFHFLSYNAMSLRTSNALFRDISSDLKIKISKLPLYETRSLLEEYFTKSSKMIILLVDEIDKLDSKNHELLYTIFDWPRIPKSKLIVIGIANTLDFTSRTLTRLDSLYLNTVKEISFRPYTKDEIVSIIKDRLKQVESSHELITDSAIEICARKVSSSSGDARKALDICKIALDSVQSEKEIGNELNAIKLTSDDGMNLGSPKKLASLKNSMKNNAAVGPNEVLRVLNQFFCDLSSQSLDLSPLPIQQQIVLCILLCYSKSKNMKQIELGKCNRIFLKVCSKTGICYDLLSNCDFLSICDTLESKGLIIFKRAKEIQSSKLSLHGNEEEIDYQVNQRSILRVVMENIFTHL